ncbi:ImmA/IrrE family metallo-endopeptidase [Loktanella sp. DJP18]|uniref:ImmA/IrrE family metallo-endopeptidase n=1 Tax=Loktanella sp. DJP18 TaxID=3409788 RepID=UPI003BB56ECD
MSRIHIPFVTPQPLGASRDEIVLIAKGAISALGLEGLHLELGIADLEGKIVMAQMPLISLEVFGPGEFVIYHGQMTNWMFNRFTIATALGHYILHYPRVADLSPVTGMQVISNQDHPEATPKQAVIEAMWFATELLMSEVPFRAAFAKGGIAGVCQDLLVTRSIAETRARSLGLAEAVAAA